MSRPEADPPVGHHDHDGHGHDHDDHGHEHASGLLGRLKELYAPHHHDTGEAVASALEATDEGLRAIKISLLGLAATAALQVAVVIASGSVALLADTIHNVVDALTAIPLGIAFWVGRRPPNRRYTYGYGRAEDLAGVFIVVAIAASAGLAGWEAIDRLFDPRPIHNLGWVIAAGVIGFIGNELVAVYRVRVGRRIGSAALVADGFHARTDGLTSLAVVGGAIGVGIGWERADPVVGLVITVVILFVLRGAARDIYHRLMDRVDPALVSQIEDVAASVDGVTGVDVVRVRWVGHELHAEVEIVSDPTISLADAHAITEDVHHRLLHDIPRLARATIHASPEGGPSGDPHAATAHHFDASR